MKAIDEMLVPETSSKERILRAALATFAQKGFEGARVDEIARQAGVNKALIYYYFKSKEEMLHALLDGAIADIMSSLGDPEVYVKEMLGSEAKLRTLMDRFLGFIEERKELFTIVVMELLKDSERRKLVLGHLGDELMKHNEAFYKYARADDPVQNLVTEIFTGFLPCIMFVLLENPLRDLYGQKGAAFRQMFLKAFEGTHIRYSMDLLKSAQTTTGGKEGAGL